MKSNIEMEVMAFIEDVIDLMAKDYPGVDPGTVKGEFGLALMSGRTPLSVDQIRRAFWRVRARS